MWCSIYGLSNLKVTHPRVPCGKFAHLQILPEALSPFRLKLWFKDRNLPWGLDLVSLPQGLEMVTVFWQSALWRARFRLPVLVFRAVFRSHSPQAWNWYLHSAGGRVGPNRNLWVPLGVPWKQTLLVSIFCSEVIVGLHAVVKNNTVRSCIPYTQFPSVVIPCIAIAPPGTWHGQSPESLFRFPQFHMLSLVYMVCGHWLPCDFITCIDKSEHPHQ